MSVDYKQARKWADKFISKQRRQLASLFSVPINSVVVADDETDIDGTDVLIGPLRIALRVRRHTALARFGLQPTIRTSVGRDGRSELDKLLTTGAPDYMLLNYATAAASTDDIDIDDFTASILLDLLPIKRAAADDFDGVQVTEISAERAHAMALDLGSIMARYGPCVVTQTVATEVSTKSDPIVVHNPATGLTHKTVETETTTRTTEATNADLLAQARQRAKATA